MKEGIYTLSASQLRQWNRVQAILGFHFFLYDLFRRCFSVFLSISSFFFFFVCLSFTFDFVIFKFAIYAVRIFSFSLSLPASSLNILSLIVENFPLKAAKSGTDETCHKNPFSVQLAGEIHKK